MDSRRLRYFVLIVNSGSITKAAASAGVAQPALSQQLAILENELRVKLLDRGLTGVTPTPAGRVLYSRAQVILRQVEELRSAVHEEVHQLSGVVILGMSPTMMTRFALPLVEKVSVQHPEMRLQIIEDGSVQLRELLLSGRIELSLSPTPPDEKAKGEEILTERLFAIHSDCFPSITGASLEDLAKLPWILARSPNSIRTLVDAVFTARNLTPRVVAEIDSLYSVVEALRRGIGVTALPEGLVRRELINGTLKGRPLGEPHPVQRPMYLTHRAAPALSAPAQFVYDLLREIGTDLRIEIQAHPLVP